MDNTLYVQKINQAISYMQNECIDLWLIYSSEGSDPAVPLMFGLKTVGKTFFILTSTGRKVAICSRIDALESQNSGLFDEVRIYDLTADELLKKTIAEMNPKTIALNYSVSDNLCDGLTAGRYFWLKDVLGGNTASKFVSAQPVLARVRSVKTPEEIKRIREAIKVTQEIYNTVFADIKAGMTEFEVGELFLREMKKHGAVNGTSGLLTMPTILKERIGHRPPGNAVIEPGDFLIMDFYIRINGYCSDIARTAYILKHGETSAPEKMQHAFKSAYDAITKAFEKLKPGAVGYEVDAAAREHLLSQGLPEVTHSVGHQLGTQVHDGGTILAPIWKRYGDAPSGIVEQNNVFTLEPTVLMPEGEYSILTEEDVLVTATGAEFLSIRQEEIVLI